MANSPSRDEIQTRAYEIYLERGCEDGHEIEHWLTAEQELSGRGSQSRTSSAGSSASSSASEPSIATSAAKKATAGASSQSRTVAPRRE